LEASPCVISRFIWLPSTSMHQARIIYILAAPTKTTVRVSVYGLCMAIGRPDLGNGRGGPDPLGVCGFCGH
jgi:hypothetical protein